MALDRNDLLRNSPKLEFPASYAEKSVEEQKQLRYPTGYHGFDSDIPRYRNPSMSVTTMKLLGLSDGSQRGLVRVIVMHFFMADRVAHAIECVNSAYPFKHAVDQDGALYMKFVHHEHAERMEKSHFFIDNQMVKFFVVENSF